MDLCVCVCVKTLDSRFVFLDSKAALMCSHRDTNREKKVMSGLVGEWWEEEEEEEEEEGGVRL